MATIYSYIDASICSKFHGLRSAVRRNDHVCRGCGHEACFAIFGRLSDRYGFRIFTFIGMGMMVITNIVFSMFVVDTPLWVVMPALFLNGLGMGLWMAPNMSATLSTVGKGDLGSMSAFLNLVRNVGSVLGQAMAIVIIAGVMLGRGTEVGLSELADAGEKISRAFLAGWSMTFWILASVAAAAVFATTRTRDYDDTPETSDT